jgi:site-specific recombinase XerD
MPRTTVKKMAAAAPGIILPVAQWPAQDQRCWRQGTDPIPGLHRPRYADTLTRLSVDVAWKSYGRLLHILAQHGLLEPDITPAARITFAVVALYFDELRAAGNQDNTIKGRLFHLRTALHIMAPKAKFDWITRPDDVPLDAILKQEPRDDLFVPEAKQLFDWGVSLMTDQPLPDNSVQRLEACRNYRNGLIIALLACRAPRLGSLAQMRLAKNLYKRNGEYWARLQSMIVKNKRELHYSLPKTLTPYLDRYLSEIRPQLLDPAASDALWGNGDGGAFTYRSIQTMINRQTQAQVGSKFTEAFGPHRFRHAFASALAEADPTNPGLAAVVLGITEGVVSEHYRQARQADAARKFQTDLSAERERTHPVAARAFARRYG